MKTYQQLVRFNQVLTEEINKKILKTLNECKPSINQVKITLKLTEK